jgi:hypothetical protein
MSIALLIVMEIDPNMSAAARHGMKYRSPFSSVILQQYKMITTIFPMTPRIPTVVMNIVSGSIMSAYSADKLAMITTTV